VIPDPTCPEIIALDSDGNVMYGVFVTKLDENGQPISERKHIGWSHE
jgi:hypothetical protein